MIKKVLKLIQYNYDYSRVVMFLVRFVFLQEIFEKRSEMMNEYKSFRERVIEEWESMKYRRLEFRDGKQRVREYLQKILVGYCENM